MELGIAQITNKTSVESTLISTNRILSILIVLGDGVALSKQNNNIIIINKIIHRIPNKISREITLISTIER